MKTILFNHKDTIDRFRLLVSANLISTSHADIVEKGGINAYRLLLRNILSLGAGLGTGKEFRDLFLTIQEKVIDVAIGFGWSCDDTCIFLDAVVNFFVEGDGFNANVQRRFRVSFSRLVEGVKLSCIRLYQIPSNFT